VANWIDVFAPLLIAEELPARWPDLLIVDSMQCRVNSGARAGLKFNVFAAVGSVDPPPGRWRDAPKVVRLAAFPTKSRASWIEFLSALEGTPRVVMSDADRALEQALRTVFPRAGDPPPDLRLSEWHIQRMLRAKVPHVLLHDRTHPVGQAFPTALVNPADWHTFESAVRAAPASGTHGPLITAINFLDDYGPRIAAQTATRQPDLSHSTSPVEAALRQVDRRIGDRVGSFTNRSRMNKLLALIALDLRGQADERHWADRLRERLYLLGGRPVSHQRTADDLRGAWSLLA
jgi:hypothetical protein